MATRYREPVTSEVIEHTLSSRSVSAVQDIVAGNAPRAVAHRALSLRTICIGPGRAPGRIRTRDPLLRRQLLYPAELQAPTERIVQDPGHAEDTSPRSAGSFAWPLQAWSSRVARAGRVPGDAGEPGSPATRGDRWFWPPATARTTLRGGHDRCHGLNGRQFTGWPQPANLAWNRPRESSTPEEEP
jgi:hypothetical protein